MRRLAKAFIEWLGNSANLLGALGFVVFILLIVLGSGSGNFSHAAGPNDAMTSSQFWTLYDEAMTGLPFSIIPMRLARLRKNSTSGDFDGVLVP